MLVTAEQANETNRSVDRQNPVRTRYRDAEGLPIMTEAADAQLHFTVIE